MQRVQEGVMCFFLTIGVPAKAAGLMEGAFGRGFQLVPTENAAIRAAFPAGYAMRLVTSGMCSCGLYIRPGTADPAEEREAHRLEKYAKRGWGGAKIRRAVAQARAVRDRAAVRAREGHWSGLRGDVVERLRGLCEAAGEVAAVVHFYNDEIESARLTLKRPPPCRCPDFPARAAALCEDEVLIATPVRGGQSPRTRS